MSDQLTKLHVRKAALTETKVTKTALRDLLDGEVLMEVEGFALTANNITYAVFGEQMKYWNFFPAEEAAGEGYGVVPVWGHAKVLASKHEQIEVGERVYGYLPMASHVIVSPGKISKGGFTDVAPHRQEMAGIYNDYRRLAADPAHDASLESERSLFSPLFTTSFLIEDMFKRGEWNGAEALVMTSASSKTAMGLAHVARANSPEIKRIGLTSPSNVAFVEKTGLYDEVVAYDEISSLDNSRPTVSVDFAGNGAVLAAIHAHWNDNLKFSSMVGATHIEARSGGQELAGPTPILFFAPTVAETVIADIGPAAFGQNLGVRWQDFVGLAASLVSVTNLNGAEAVEPAYQEMLAGRTGPDEGLICSIAS